MKRPLDALAAGLGLVALAPLMGAVAAAIRLESPGPVLYHARRTGRGGASFTMYKFRTMHTRRDEHGPRITQHADQRVTRVGRLLRPTRLDELPQLWNVLVGDMSLVGPRPEDPHYVEVYPARFRPVLRARPGITSLAALLYRDEERLLVGEDWEQVYVDEVMPAKLEIDLDYLRRQSLWLDAQILLATALSAIGLGRLVPPPHPPGGMQAAEARRRQADDPPIDLLAGGPEAAG
ncbi:MAG: sugar transferase [Chloroflexi bacterium]|nr:sugar transferase [Chloroflexota bacterium]